MAILSRDGWAGVCSNPAGDRPKAGPGNLRGELALGLGAGKDRVHLLGGAADDRLGWRGVPWSRICGANLPSASARARIASTCSGGPPMTVWGGAASAAMAGRCGNGGAGGGRRKWRRRHRPCPQRRPTAATARRPWRVGAVTAVRVVAGGNGVAGTGLALNGGQRYRDAAARARSVAARRAGVGVGVVHGTLAGGTIRYPRRYRDAAARARSVAARRAGVGVGVVHGTLAGGTIRRHATACPPMEPHPRADQAAPTWSGVLGCRVDPRTQNQRHATACPPMEPHPRADQAAPTWSGVLGCRVDPRFARHRPIVEPAGHIGDHQPGGALTAAKWPQFGGGVTGIRAPSADSRTRWPHRRPPARWRADGGEVAPIRRPARLAATGEAVVAGGKGGAGGSGGVNGASRRDGAKGLDGPAGGDWRSGGGRREGRGRR